MNSFQGNLPETAGVGTFGYDVETNFLESGKIDSLVVIDGRNLERECFVRSIVSSHPGVGVSGFSSPQEWLKPGRAELPPTAVLFNVGSRDVSSPAVGREIARLASEAGPAPVIVLAESEDLQQMIAALDLGARGYIPASVSFDVIVEATRLACSGGMFLPASSVPSLRNTISRSAEVPAIAEDYLTSRQSAVAAALRRGKANKIIAYELNMSESTVKVHIRNIMKKLKASNRTEAAFKLNSTVSGHTEEVD